ncbi:MAG: protein GlxC [Rhodobacteraceae bacterium]|nr:protein GlxC [Paracoccaceae bacterium]
MSGRGDNPVILDLEGGSLRAVNARLQAENRTDSETYFRLLNPGGAHSLACGLDAPVLVGIEGHAGYFCAGMNQRAHVVVEGNAGQGVAENMMSGRVHVKGNSSQSAGATAHGGLLVIEGNAAARCGVSLKGADIVVKGSVGHMSMFMAQAGRLVVLGDAGDALGDSIYEARIYVRGKVGNLGADCVRKPMRDTHWKELKSLLQAAGCGNAETGGFQRYGSARELYHFKVGNVRAY